MAGATALVPKVAAASFGGSKASLSTPGSGGYPVNYTPDVVVAGSGQGGFTAAIAAAEAGAKVVLVEISSRTGGPARYAAGSIHTNGMTSYAQFAQEQNGFFNVELSQAFWNNYVPAYTWLHNLGAYFTINPPPALGGTYGGGATAEPYPVRNGKYLDSLERIFLGANGTLLLNTRAMQLLTDSSGKIAGLRVQNVNAATGTVGPAGTYDIQAPSVILSTGSFFANNEMVSKYISPSAVYGNFMGHPYNMGDGITMAQAVGASLDGWMANGCYSPGPGYPPTNTNWPMNPNRNRADYESRQQNTQPGVGIGEYWLGNYQEPPPQLIYVNWNGKRFMNEDNTSNILGYHYYFTMNNFYDQPLDQAWAIYDDAMWQPWGPAQHTLTDIGSCSHAYSLSLLQKWGGVVITANTITDLAAQIVALNKGYQGLNSAVFIDTINEYNAAVKAGTAMNLEVPRTGTIAPIQTPPFYAVLHTDNRIMTQGGLAINAQAQVLDGQKFPIPGLYATPPLANSGVQRYGGGISYALVFGYLAGNAAAAFVKTHK